MLEVQPEVDQSYLNKIMDTSPNLIIVTNGTNTHSVNQAFLNFTNQSTATSFAQTKTCISDLFLDADDNALLKKMRDLSWLEYVIAHPLERLAYLQKDDVIYAFNVYVHAIEIRGLPYYAVIFNNITELENQKKRFAQALEASHAGLLDWNLKENTVYFSPRFENMLGAEEGSLPNTFASWKECIHPDDLEMVIKEVSANIKGETDSFKCIHRLHHKEGHWVWIDVRGKTYFSKEGKPLQMIGSYNDITAEHIALEEVEKKDELLITQSRNAAMGEMISMVAHQWRQPIGVIAMCVNNMLIDIELENIQINEFEKHLHDILFQTEHLSSTIDDFRNFFKIDKNKEIVAIEHVLESTLNLVRKSFEANNISISLDIQSHTAIQVYPRELMQVFLNIFNNAKEAFEGKPVENRTISIALLETKEKVITTICDNAGGINEATISKVFEPYFSTKNEKNGTGLGLYMSKTIIEKHMLGNIKVYNKDDGACFEISLPKSYM